jgi:VIT1/CCC1 family predicted Fe2+/Mn2+ transporter
VSEQPPRRVRVVSPRRSAARAASSRAVSRDIDEQTHVGEVYMGSLMRTQLRLAIGICLIFGVLLGGLPLLFAVDPGLAEVSVAGVPLPWVLLGVLVYPALIAGAWVYVRQAERNERDWVELVERS